MFLITKLLRAGLNKCFPVGKLSKCLAEHTEKYKILGFLLGSRTYSNKIISCSLGTEPFIGWKGGVEENTIPGQAENPFVKSQTSSDHFIYVMHVLDANSK